MDEQSYIEQVNHHVEIGNYHAAINIAISGMNACRKENNQACIDRMLEVIYGVYKAMATKFGSKEHLGKIK